MTITLFIDLFITNAASVIQGELAAISDINQPFDQTMGAIITSFFFLGSFFVMGIYMFLLFIQNRKNDYLLYGFYLLVFTFYFLLRIDDVLKTDLFGKSYVLHQHLLTPLLLIITAIYVRFINLFAEIKRYNAAFSKRLNIFCILLLITAAGIICFTIITNDFGAIRRTRSYFTLPMHAYTLLALIRAFVIIKSKIRHYILWSNIFLFTFSIIGVYWANALPGKETITSNTLFGFYAFNASQLGIFLEMICFSLGLGYKFSLIEKEKDEVNAKYILELQKNEEVTRQLNEELTNLVKQRTEEIQNKNKLLQEEQAVKSTFFTNISHELRTPITLILGPIQEMLKNPEDRDKNKSLLVMMERNSIKLLRLVEQLLDISKLDMGKMHLKESPIRIKSFLTHLVEPFVFAANKRNIKFSFSENYKEQQIIIDKDILEKVLVNLISNAIKYTPDKGIVVCNVQVNKSEFNFSIKNTGKGLSKDELPKIFDRFYRTNDNDTPGTGIGLALVKELVELAKGSIKVESNPGDWTRFNLSIPCSAIPSDAQEYHENTKIASNRVLLGFEDSSNDFTYDERSSCSEKQTILIIDDNKDLLDYLKQLLNPKYNILQAVNGKEGLNKANTHSPDLILSDVMMPEMNGLELSNHIKNDVSTSHIPLVLLTAKAGVDHTLEGLKLGVDDYLVKPFNSDLLLAKIETMLLNRSHLRRFYSTHNGIRPQNLPLNNLDEKFFSQLENVAKTKLKEPNFNVEELCKYLGMGRMQLHRKLKATLGVSASEFINIERLKLAKMLLEKSNSSISEIAYASGFNSPGYFSKRFKRQFGETAGDYRKRFHTIR